MTQQFKIIVFLIITGESGNYKKKLLPELQEIINDWARKKCKDYNIEMLDKWGL